MLVDGLSRKQLQELAIRTLLEAGTIAGPKVYEARDWPTDPVDFPMVLVQTPYERKTSLSRGIIQFNTVITLVTVGRVVGTSPGPVNEALDILSGQIENALMCSVDFVRNIQQFVTVETRTVVNSDSKHHIGEVSLSLECEVYQSFGPDGGVPLRSIRGEIITNGETLTVNADLSREGLRRAWEANRP